MTSRPPEQFCTMSLAARNHSGSKAVPLRDRSQGEIRDCGPKKDCEKYVRFWRVFGVLFCFVLSIVFQVLVCLVFGLFSSMCMCVLVVSSI